MALSFPAAPEVNDIYTSGGYSWQWDGVSWRSIGLAMAGNAAITDVTAGKYFYTTSPMTKQTGTSTAVETGDADAVAGQIDVGYTAYVDGVKITGTRLSEYLTNPPTLTVPTLPSVSVGTAVAAI